MAVYKICLLLTCISLYKFNIVISPDRHKKNNENMRNKINKNYWNYSNNNKKKKKEKKSERKQNQLAETNGESQYMTRLDKSLNANLVLYSDNQIAILCIHHILPLCKKVSFFSIWGWVGKAHLLVFFTQFLVSLTQSETEELQIQVIICPIMPFLFKPSVEILQNNYYLLSVL